jgi:hypothetical protein
MLKSILMTVVRSLRGKSCEKHDRRRSHEEEERGEDPRAKKQNRAEEALSRSAEMKPRAHSSDDNRNRQEALAILRVKISEWAVVCLRCWGLCVAAWPATRNLTLETPWPWEIRSS